MLVKKNVWIRNRSGKGGGGVMILTMKCVRLEKVIISKDKYEISQVMIESENRKL